MSEQNAEIYYYDIGDYLSREQKLDIITNFKSMENLPFTRLTPNEHGDWISQRNDKFSEWIPIEPEKKYKSDSKSWFVAQSMCVVTSRDSWVINYSQDSVITNVNKAIDFYNSQVDLYKSEIKKNPSAKIESIINWDEKKFKWDRAQKERDLFKFTKYEFK